MAVNTSTPTDKLYRVFEEIHDHIYANEGLSTQQVFSEMLKILFLKVFDEKNNKQKLFLINFAEYEDISRGKENSSFLNRFNSLKQNAFGYFSDLFKPNEDIELKLSSVGYAVNKLQIIDLSSSSRDVKGLAFQKFVHSKQRGERGQFFTPDQIIKLCVEIIQPTYNDIMLDPACGSGGFLSESMKYVFNHSLKNRTEDEKRKYVKNNLFGIEINSMIARMAKMRMILEGDGYSNIITSDSLANWDNLNHDISKTNGQLRDYQYYFDIIMTNPPFGTQGKISNENILQEYELSFKPQGQEGKKNKISGQVPDILFIERSLNFLKEGGKLAIVLPNGDLENSSLDYVREFIKDKTDLLVVIKLPTETFIPFGTGVKTSILFLQKKGGHIKTPGKVFFGLIEKIGYEGNKNGTIVYKKDSNGKKVLNDNGENVIDEDLTDLISSYKKFLTGNFKDSNKFFAINREDIKSRFDLEYYKPSSKTMEKNLSKKNAIRLGELVEIKKIKSTKLKQLELTVKYIELADINTDYFEISNFTYSKVHDLPSRASYEIKEDDILTAVAGNAIGTKKHMSAIVPTSLSGSICTNGFRILRAKKINPYYLLYYLRTPYFLEQVYKYRTGAAIPSISDSDLENILVFRPSLKKEEEIAKMMSEAIKLKEEAKRILNNIELNL